MKTDEKGQIAILKVKLEALKKGAITSTPDVPVRYDLVVDWQGKMRRAQVKYADARSHASGAVYLDLRRRKRCYTDAEIDVLLVYIPQLDAVCWFGREWFHHKAALALRVAPTKNGQKRGCLMAKDFIW